MATAALFDSTELWLVQAPAGMDVQALHGCVVNVGSAHDGQMRMESSAGSFAWVDLEQQVANSVCLLPDGGGSRAPAGQQRFTATPAFARKVLIYRTDEVHSAALTAHKATKKPRVAQPQGMRVRFRPLGDTAQPAAALLSTERAKKKRKDKSPADAHTPVPTSRAEGGERTEKKSDKKEKKKDRTKRDRGDGDEDKAERKRRKEHKHQKHSKHE